MSRPSLWSLSLSLSLAHTNTHTKGWAGYVPRMEKARVVFKMLAGKINEKRPLGGPRRIWEGNIRKNLKKMVQKRGILVHRLRIGVIGEPL